MKKKLLFYFIVVAIIIAFTAVSVYAEYTGSCGDNANYTLSDEGVLTIRGSGAVTNTTDIDQYKDNIVAIRFEEGITSLCNGPGSFSGYTKVASISFPSTLQQIGSSVFSGCSSLTQIEIPSSVTSIGWYAFDDCTSLKEIIIKTNAEINWAKVIDDAPIEIIKLQNSVTEIADEQFCGIGTLKTVVLPATVTSIGARAFLWCHKLESINIPSGVQLIGDAAFDSCAKLNNITLPEQLKTIGQDAFAQCSSLTSIVIPSSVTSIGNGAFEDCRKLAEFTVKTNRLARPLYLIFGDFCFVKTITLDNSATEIKNNEFEFLESVKKIVLPDSITKIGNLAFMGCWALQEIKLPANLKSIGGSAFNQCAHLAKIDLPEGLVSIGSDAFYGTQISSLTIPSTVTSIGSFDCSLKTLYINSSANIKWGTLLNDNSRSCEVYLGNGITKIYEGQFSSTSEVHSLHIPKSVTTVEKNAFKDCEYLSSVYYAGTEEEWNALKRNGINRTGNSALTGATVYFGDMGDKCGPSAKWSFNGEELQISGSGNMFEFTSPADAPWYRYSSEIKSISLSSWITNISDYAFAECINLERVMIDTQLTSIGENAFASCSKIQTVIADHLDLWGKTAIASGNDYLLAAPSLKLADETEKPASVSILDLNGNATLDTTGKFIVKYHLPQESSENSYRAVLAAYDDAGKFKCFLYIPEITDPADFDVFYLIDRSRQDYSTFKIFLMDYETAQPLSSHTE